jgi:signal peptidase II
VPRQRLDRRVNVNVVVWALGVCALDSLSKWWARHHVSASGRHVLGPLWLRLTYNSGISFSLNATGPIVTTLVALAIVLVVAFVAAQAVPGLPTVGFGLLLGGGVSNEIDRLARVPHQVTDFISVGWFPVFNLADAAVTIGFVLLFVSLLRGSRLVER